MRKLRIGVLLTTGALGLGLSGPAWADRGGDSNAGDVWLDNVNQPAGPGHEMDPHLACQNINLWSSGLSDATGGFTIDGWSASGSHGSDYAGTWNLASKAGEQIVAVIDVSKLIAQAEANGDGPGAQGFHFKLDSSQDPQKHKTFWVDCPPSSGDGGSTGGGGGTTGGGGTSPGPSDPGSPAAPSTVSVSTPAVTTTASGPVKTAIGAVTARRPRRPVHKRHRRLVHPARHMTARHRHVKPVSAVRPQLTG